MHLDQIILWLENLTHLYNWLNRVTTNYKVPGFLKEVCMAYLNQIVHKDNL